LLPFHVLKESVGFIFNRIWTAIKRESLAVVAEGVSTPLAYYLLVSIAKGIAGPFEWPADVASSGDYRAYLERRCDSGAYLDMDSVPQTIPKLPSRLQGPV
jgi:hypothetical protein